MKKEKERETRKRKMGKREEGGKEDEEKKNSTGLNFAKIVKSQDCII